MPPRRNKIYIEKIYSGYGFFRADDFRHLFDLYQKLNGYKSPRGYRVGSVADADVWLIRNGLKEEFLNFCKDPLTVLSDPQKSNTFHVNQGRNNAQVTSTNTQLQYFVTNQPPVTSETRKNPLYIVGPIYSNSDFDSNDEGALHEEKTSKEAQTN